MRFYIKQLIFLQISSKSTLHLKNWCLHSCLSKTFALVVYFPSLQNVPRPINIFTLPEYEQ